MKFAHTVLILIVLVIFTACVNTNSSTTSSPKTALPTPNYNVSIISGHPSSFNEAYIYIPSPNLASVNHSLLPHIIPNSSVKGRTEKTLKFYNIFLSDSDDQSAIIVHTISYEIHLSINNSVYYGAKNSPKDLINFPTISLDDNYNLSYNAMIDDVNQNELYSDLLGQLRKYRDINHYDDDQYLEFLVRFVQSIPYNETNAHKFPIEVVFENGGVCDDKSKLLAGILERENYDVSLFIVSLKNPIGKYQNHMFVGVKSNGLQYNGTSYSLIDTTTTEYPVAPIQYQYIGAPDLGAIKPQVIIIKVGNGTKMYQESGEVSFLLNKSHEIGDLLNNRSNSSSNLSPSVSTLQNLNFIFSIGAPDRQSTFLWLTKHADLKTLPDNVTICSIENSYKQSMCN